MAINKGLENIPMYNPYHRQFNAVRWRKLMWAVYAYCCGVDKVTKKKINEDAIIPEYIPVWLAFKKDLFNFCEFMGNRDYEQIEDEELRVEVLMSVCFPILDLPIAKFMADWLNGYLDFFKRDPDNNWCAWEGTTTYTDVLRYLFLCSKEKDIWKMMANGIGDIESLYRWYLGTPDPDIEEATGVPCYCEKDEEKAAEFLDYLMNESTEATEAVRKEATRLKTIYRIMRNLLFFISFTALIGCGHSEKNEDKYSGIPSTAQVVAENEDYVVLLNDEATEDNIEGLPPIKQVSLWSYGKSQKSAKKILLSHPHANSSWFSMKHSVSIPLDSIPTISKVCILSWNGEPLKLLVEGSSDYRNVQSFIINEDSAQAICLPTNRGLIGISEEEYLLIMQSYAYYKEGGRYNIIEVYDDMGNRINSMKAKRQ